MNLEWLSFNPNPGTICEACAAMIGQVFAPEELAGDVLPLHPNCYCLLLPTDKDVTTIDWSALDPAILKTFVYRVAYLLRIGAEIPRIWERFIQEAKDYNQSREQEALMLEESERLQLQAGHLLLSEVSDRTRYPAVLIEAGLNQNGWIMPIEALAEAMSLFDGAPCLLNHTGFFSHPDVEKWAGTYERPMLAGNELRATLRKENTSAGHALAEIVDALHEDEEAGLPTPPIGLSFDISLRWKPRDNSDDPHECAKITKVWSVDLVLHPAAGGRVERVLNSLSTGGILMPEETTPQVQATSTPPAPAPVNVPDPGIAALAQQVQGLADTVAQLSQHITREREDNVVQDNGRAHLDIVGVSTGLDAVRLAMDWIVGAPGAKAPAPFLRDLRNIYQLTTGDLDWRGVFQPDRVTLAAANPTTLPGLVADSMNKVIIETWETLWTYRWYELVVAVQPNDGSLQDMKWITFGGIGNLPTVSYGAEYTELTVGDTKEADGFAVYGGYVGVDRKTLRNSDIARMQAIPRALAIASVRTRSANIAGIFTANAGVGPTLDDDTTALFHSNHSNLATTAYSITAWKAARLECYKQTEDTSSKRMGFWPKFWLGPADLYDQALIDFGYGAGAGGYPGTGDNDVNPYAVSRPGDPRPVPIAVPDFTDTNDWAYLTDPAVQPVIMMSYASNPGGRTHPAPELFTVTSPLAGLMFERDTLPIKVRDEYAYGVATYRGIGKRNVS